MKHTANYWMCTVPLKYLSCMCEICAKIQQAIRPPKDLTIVKRRKWQWHGHVSRSSGLAKTILQGTVKRGKKTRQTEKEVGRQHQRMDRPGVRQVPEGSGKQGKKWRKLVAKSSVVPQRPSHLRDRWERWECFTFALQSPQSECPCLGLFGVDRKYRPPRWPYFEEETTRSRLQSGCAFYTPGAVRLRNGPVPGDDWRRWPPLPRDLPVGALSAWSWSKTVELVCAS